MGMFWMVFVPSRGLHIFPPLRHESENAAVAEAQRIAEKEKIGVYVLECIGVMEPLSPPVEWRDFRKQNPPPDADRLA